MPEQETTMTPKVKQWMRDAVSKMHVKACGESCKRSDCEKDVEEATKIIASEYAKAQPPETPLYEVYENDDAIIPMLSLPSPCGIRVELHNDKVIVHVGQRDWCWNRRTGELDNAGTIVGEDNHE